MEGIKIISAFEIFLVATLSFIVALPSIKAEVSDINTCCKITNSNEFCVSGAKKEQCANGFNEFTTCENVPGCDTTSLGCCEINNVCNSQTTEFSCNAVSGVFHKNTECGELSQCNKVCCTVGEQCSFRPANQCTAVGGILEENVGSESSCINICNSQEKGCCSESCSYGAKGECADENFYSAFCSSVSSCSTKCKPHASKDCGEDGQVYWLDSCGNKEEIAEKCNPGLTSGETTSCSKKDGEAKCLSWDCSSTWDNPVVDENGDGINNNDGGPRKNGESWCEYQAAVGPTLDLPGTQHYLHSCVRGEEVVQSCGEKRESICMYGDVKEANGLSIAFCAPNSAAKCPSSTDQEGCSKNGCVWIANEGAVSIEGNKEGLYNIKTKITYYVDDEKFIIDGEDIDADLREDNYKLYIEGPTSQSISFSNAEMKSEKMQTEGTGKETQNIEVYYFDFDVEAGDYKLKIGDNKDDAEDYFSFSTDDIVSSTTEKGKCLPLVPPAGDALCESGNNLFEKAAEWNKDCYTCDWHCESNCNVYSPDTKKTMNGLCNAYGDCGAKYNLAKAWSKSGFKRNCDPNEEDYSRIDAECLSGSSTLKQSEADSFDNYQNAGKGISLGDFSIVNFLASTAGLDAGEVLFLVGSSAVQGAIIGGAFGAGIFSWATAGIGAAIGAAIGLIASLGKEYIVGQDSDTRAIAFSCKAWEPPSDSKDCSKCYTTQNKGGLLPDKFVFKYDVNNPEAFPQYSCTKTLCESLGSCEFVDGAMTNEGPKCLELDLSLIMPPKIKYLSSSFECNDEEPGTVGGCAVKETERGIAITGMLKEFSSLNITFKTVNKVSGKEELAICAYSTKFNEGFDDLVPNFEESGLMSVKHNLKLENIKQNKSYSLQAFCQSGVSQKKTTIEPFIITFEAAAEPDLMPPAIKQIIPANGKAFVPYGVTKKEISVILNEDVDSFGGCKWSQESGVQYANMSHNFECSSGGLNSQPMCKTMLSGIAEGEDNNYYFRCKDKSGNANEEDWPQEGGVSMPYVVKASPSLNISSIRCAHMDGADCSSPIYDKQFNLSVTTQEGAENGIAMCSLGTSAGSMNSFLETNSTEHFQPGIKLSEGKHAIYLNCADIAGNSVDEKIDVEFKVDRDAPFIKSIYAEGSTVKLNTDERATCKYEWNSTVFNFNTALDIPSNDKILHSFTPESMNFILACADRFGNMNNPINVYLVK